MIRILFLGLFCFPFSVYASFSNEYDLDFLTDEFTAFEDKTYWISGGLTPGVHSLGVAIGSKKEQTMKVEFIDINGDVTPCFDELQLTRLGIAKPQQDKICYTLKDINPEASYQYTSSLSLITLRVPNINLLKADSKYKTRKELWDHGVTSAKANYNSYVSTDSQGRNSGYIGANGLLSIGQWRIKGSASYFKTNDYGSYDSGDIYAFTDIDPISSQLSVGQITTSGGMSVNSSLPITGMKLMQSQQMLNPDWSSYAPVIKDRVNSTSAKVSVLDESRVVFSQVFTTGEFEISEFDVASVGSELTLVIEEDNGTIRRKTIPYTRLPNMLKENSYTYSLSAGQYRGRATTKDPALLSGQFRYGFGAWTSEVDLLAGSEYQYAEFENTFDLMNIGAVSFGAGLSNTEDDWGYLVQASYAKYIKNTDTSLQFAGTQYRSESFRTFNDFVSNVSNSQRVKNTIDVSINQKVDDYTLYLGYQRKTFHSQSDDAQESLYASMNTNISKADVGMSISRDYYSSNDSRSEMRYGLNLSIPLARDVRLSDYMNANDSGAFNNTLSLTTTNGQTDYSLSALTNVNNGDSAHSVSGSANQKTRYGDFGARADWSKDRSKLTLSAAGGVLAYSGGAVLTPRLGDTTAVVEFGNEAEDVVLNYNQQSKTNSRGIGVVTYPMPYRSNEIYFDTTASTNVEVVIAPGTYVPRLGATVVIPVQALVGSRKLVAIDSELDLFGEAVFEQKSNSRISFVGVDNVVYLSGLKTDEINRFTVGQDNKCQFDIDMSKNSDSLNDVITISCEG